MINTLLVLVSLSVYTFFVSKAMFSKEDKFHQLSGVKMMKCRDRGRVDAWTQSGGLCVGRLRCPAAFSPSTPHSW
jgi:hypothetical protein